MDHADFYSARGEVRWTHTFARGSWSARSETRTILSGNADAFRIQADLDAYVGEQRVFCRTWEDELPRGLL